MPDCYPRAYDEPAEALAKVELPAVSRHAATRWDERTPVDSVAPETAWRDARAESAVDAAVNGTIEAYADCDEARYHEPTGTALLRKDAVIVTVLPNFDPRIRTAVEYAKPAAETEVCAR
jgi:hypothetical protein